MAACSEHGRALRARTAAAAGHGLPAVEPGMPSPAGTGMSRRSFVLRSASLALSVYGAGRLGLFEPGVAQAAAGPVDPVVVQVYLEGGIDSLQVLAPVGDPQLRRLRPTLALDPGAGEAFGEDPACGGTRPPRRWPTLHREGKVCVHAGGRLRRTRTSRTSSHATSTRSARWTRGPARAGWGATWTASGSPDNPLQGLSLDGALAPALATASKPVSAIDSPGAFDFWARGVWGDVERAHARRLRAARLGPCRLRRPGAAPGRHGRGPGRVGPPSAAAFRPSEGRPFRRARRSSLRWPTPRARTTSRDAWPASRRCSPPGCRCAACR